MNNSPTGDGDRARELIATALQQDWYIPGRREGEPPTWVYRQADVVLGALAAGGAKVVFEQPEEA